MKIITAVIIVVIVAGGWWWYTNQETSSPVDEIPEVADETSTPNSIVEEEGDEEVNNVSFDVSGTNFAFDLKEIRVKQGQTVTINFASEEGFHDWVVDEFGAATEQIIEGTTSSVTFVANKKGEFEYYCSVGNHREQGMVGTLIVE